MDFELIVDFAKKRHEFVESVSFLTTWKSYDVYKRVNKNGIRLFLGYPQFILVSGDTIRCASPDEDEQILDHLNTSH